MEPLTLISIGIIAGFSGFIIGWGMSQDGLSAFSDEIDRLREQNSRLSEQLHAELTLQSADDDNCFFCPDPDCCSPDNGTDLDTLPPGIRLNKAGKYVVTVRDRKGNRHQRTRDTLSEAVEVKSQLERSFRTR